MAPAQGSGRKSFYWGKFHLVLLVISVFPASSVGSLACSTAVCWEVGGSYCVLNVPVDTCGLAGGRGVSCGLRPLVQAVPHPYPLEFTGNELAGAVVAASVKSKAACCPKL